LRKIFPDPPNQVLVEAMLKGGTVEEAINILLDQTTTGMCISIAVAQILLYSVNQTMNQFYLVSSIFQIIQSLFKTNPILQKSCLD
jgi:hypothetical protein